MNTSSTENIAQSSADLVAGIPDFYPLSNWDPKPVDWLWEPYLATGMLTMLSGPAGTGKTCIALDIAAAVTAGRRTPPANVLYLTAADNPECVLRPRFEACGGDASRLHLVRGVLPEAKDQRCEMQLAEIDALGRLIGQTAAALVVVDPLHSYLNPPYARRARVRAVLDRLSRLAEDKRCAFLLVRSQGRTATGRPAEFEAVRSMMLAGESLDDPASRCRALVHLRSNCGLTGPSLGYAIEPGGALRWTGESELSAWAILEPEPAPEKKSMLKNAMEFLLGELRHGPREGRYVLQEAKRVGIRERTLNRAKARLKVLSQRDAREWFWSLPEKTESENTESENNVVGNDGNVGNLGENKGGVNPSGETRTLATGSV